MTITQLVEKDLKFKYKSEFKGLLPHTSFFKNEIEKEIKNKQTEHISFEIYKKTKEERNLLKLTKSAYKKLNADNKNSFQMELLKSIAKHKNINFNLKLV